MKKSDIKKLKQIKKKHGTSILVAAITSLIISLYVYFGRFKSFGIVGPNPLWGAAAVFAAIFLFSFALLMSLLNYKKIKKKKMIKDMIEHKNELISLAVSLFFSCVLFWRDPQITWLNFIIAFGTSFALCESCSYAPTWKLQSFKELGNNFLLYFCIPFLFVSIILIGAMAGKYHPQADFLQQATHEITRISVIIADALAAGVIKAVTVLYNLGYNQPELFLYVSIAALVFSFLAVIKKTFTKPEGEEEDKRRWR